MAQPKKSTAKKTGKKASAKKPVNKEYNSHQLRAIILFILGVFLFFALLIKGQNIWTHLHNILFGMFGAPAFLLPVLMIYLAIMYTMEKSFGEVKHKVWQCIVLALLSCGAMQILAFGKDLMPNLFATISDMYTEGMDFRGGGVVGAIVGWPLIKLAGATGASIIITLLVFLFVMLITGGTLHGMGSMMSKSYKKIADSYNEKSKTPKFDIDVELDDKEALPNHPVLAASGIDIPLSDKEEKSRLKKAEKSVKPKKPAKNKIVEVLDANTPAPAAGPPLDMDEIIDKVMKNPKKVDKGADDTIVTDLNNQTRLYEDNQDGMPYRMPPISLLKIPKLASTDDVSEELKGNAENLVETLKSFGVQTRIVDISRGPTVTRYELQPSAGVKISKITGLSDDIAMNLATAGVRIEAPIPNKAAVGIEVPNKVKDIVTIREIVEANSFDASKSKLTAALGKDISGNSCVTDLAKMPHMLIAGATGSGKSVCINSIIISLLYKSTPDEVKLLMVDPKVVELGVYNGIPHLLIPVVTDPRKAAGALGWAVTEMLKRYKMFADNGVRDIQGYNRMAGKDQEIQKMPQIVIIIDELADLMMVAPNEVEDAICRLAQMARAAGMHLIIATQRPSVDVITGIIKANIPSRVAFSVSSQVDSRTILDGGGAEKLLGQGDMLYYPVGASKPQRLQGCFVSDKEVEHVVDFIKNKQVAAYDEEIINDIEKLAVQEKSNDKGSGGGFDDEDEMLNPAIECVVEAGQASTSFLQRKLKLGYARAARIMDMLEERGIVGPFEGSKPRQVLMSKTTWLEKQMRDCDEEVSEE